MAARLYGRRAGADLVRDHGPGIAAYRSAARLRSLLPRRGRNEDAHDRHGHGTLDRAGAPLPAEQGRIWVENCPPDGGAAFTIAIPAPVKVADPCGHPGDMTSRSPRILLVDDEPAIQRSVGPLLRSRGYEVYGRRFRTEALKRGSVRAGARCDRARPGAFPIWKAPKSAAAFVPRLRSRSSSCRRAAPRRQSAGPRAGRRGLRHEAVRAGRTLRADRVALRRR